MTIDNWFNLVGTLANVAVAIAAIVTLRLTVETLRLIRTELHNVEQNQKAAAAQSITSGERELWLSVLSDEEMTAVLATHLKLTPDFLKGIGDLKPGNSLRILLFFRQYENIFYQHDNGMLDEKLWAHWEESMKYTFRNPIVREIFDQAHVGYSQKFKDFISENLIPEILKEEGVFRAAMQQAKKT